MTCWIVIPIKSRPNRKTRLADALDENARDELVLRMAVHVANVAGTAQGADTVRFLVVTPDGLPGDIALIHEAGNGLNAALTEALMQAGQSRATRVVFIAGDLPKLTSNEVALLANVSTDMISIAPDRHGVGTNAISLPLPHAADFRFAFGVDSLARHRHEADRLGLDLVEVRSDGLAHDVDLPADLGDAAGLA